MINRTKCPVCGNRKKPYFELCYECNQKGEEAPSVKELENEEQRKNGKKIINRIEKDSNFPSHTLLYRDLHAIEDMILLGIFNRFNWTFEKKGLFGMQKTEFSVSIEEMNWDIVFRIHKTPEKSIMREICQKGDYIICLEYKSSIIEWGKQVDSFFRQIKTRINKSGGGDLNVLCSFDDRFEKYDNACKKAGLLLTIPHVETAVEWAERIHNYKGLFKPD